jgi:HSP20 family molecular chaperone IbpA
MSHSDFFSTLRSSDHDFIAALRFLDDYAKHVHERGHHHQVYRNFVPRFDLEQHADTYELYGELPGFRRENIIIEAHDDHNLQVSGSISPVTSQPAPSSEADGSKDKKASKAESQDAQPKLNQLEATTTDQERYLNARFGDVLDPNAEFVKGEKKAEANPEKSDAEPKVRCLIAERNPCSFHRAFHFPTPIMKDAVTATMQDGILHITAPRAPMPPPVKVEVRDEPVYYYPGLVM